jgi:hypothetical protein
MTELDLIRLARVKALEGLATLDAAAELFPNDRDRYGGVVSDGVDEYQRRVDDLRKWIFDESRIA